MTKYEIKKVIGQTKTGNEFKALQIVAHTDVGDYHSSYIFPSSFRPAQSPNWFNDDNSSTDLDSVSRSSHDLTDLYKDSEFSL